MGVGYNKFEVLGFFFENATFTALSYYKVCCLVSNFVFLPKNALEKVHEAMNIKN